MKIALKPAAEKFVQSQVAQGRFKTPSDVINDGLMMMRYRERFEVHTLDELKEGIQAGLNSPMSDFDPEEIIAIAEKELEEEG